MLSFVAVHMMCTFAYSCSSMNWMIDDSSTDQNNPELINDEPADGDQTGPESGLGSDDLIIRQHPWAYVSIPYHGNYSLQEVMDVGSQGWIALEDFGVPIERYELVEMFTANPNVNNGGISVLMLTDHCLADFNGDGRVTGADASLFTLAYLAGDPSADLNRNGIVEIFDQLVFLSLVGQDCVHAW